MEVAGERLSAPTGSRLSGLAGIMSDAGLTNGAFYPHFKSKADLVRESLARGDGGSGPAYAAKPSLPAASKRPSPHICRRSIATAPETGCTSELSAQARRQPLGGQRDHTAWASSSASPKVASALPGEAGDREETAIGIYATLIGTLQLARAVNGTPLSDRILVAGAAKARELASGGSKSCVERG